MAGITLIRIFDVQTKTNTMGQEHIFDRRIQRILNRKKTADFKVLVSHSVSGLNQQIKEHLFEGWRTVGGHQVVKKHEQLRFSGLQHKDTIIEVEYSQSMIKE